MGVQGPRGVAPSEGGAGDPGNTAGRLPGYIFYPDISLEVWGAVDTLGSYSAAYAFGAYLTRNYGGADFVRRVVQSAYPDERSVVSAAESASGRAESMVGLLARWGVAALLSGRTDAPEGYRYNSGGFFTSSVGGAEYRLGSINMYNYLVPDGVDSDGDGLGDTDLTAPYAYAPADIGDLYGGAYSNAFMDLGDPAIRNNQDWTLRVPPGMTATIVID
jgi:hypothetical protein